MSLARRYRLLWSIPLALGLVYILLLGYFSLREDSFVYFPRKGLREAPDLGAMSIERTTLTTDDGVRLVAWKMKQPDARKWILYLHGNGGNISSRGSIRHYEMFRSIGVNVLAVDYRGYGESEGEPSEQGLYLDGLASFRYLTESEDVAPRNIVLYGYSLGSAVSVHVASVIEAGGVVLEGAFTSAPDLGRHFYPFLPTHLMMKNRFDSISKVDLVTEPKLFIHATDDEVVPIRFGRQLFEASPGPKSFLETRGGHNTALATDPETFHTALMQFLRRLDGLVE